MKQPDFYYFFKISKSKFRKNVNHPKPRAQFFFIQSSFKSDIKTKPLPTKKHDLKFFYQGSLTFPNDRDFSSVHKILPIIPLLYAPKSPNEQQWYGKRWRAYRNLSNLFAECVCQIYCLIIYLTWIGNLLRLCHIPKFQRSKRPKFD